MADVPKAVDSVLREEDATLSGVITDTKGDDGGKTRFGIASRFHPELLESTYYTTMDAADALQIAVLTMEKDYATPMRIAAIEDQVLATKFLSFGVNASPETAVRAMQYAVNRVYPGSALEVTVDGEMGPLTVAAINRCMAESLLNSFRLRMVGYYNSICRPKPSQLKFLCGWIDRALM